MVELERNEKKNPSDTEYGFLNTLETREAIFHLRYYFRSAVIDMDTPMYVS